jgi:hypothetical protein
MSQSGPFQNMYGIKYLYGGCLKCQECRACEWLRKLTNDGSMVTSCEGVEKKFDRDGWAPAFLGAYGLPEGWISHRPPAGS